MSWMTATMKAAPPSSPCPGTAQNRTAPASPSAARPSPSDGQIIVDAGDTDQVQLVLDGVSITCSDSSPILVRNADKVKVTLAADSENTLTDGASYAENDDNPDAALFSKDDLILNGSGTLRQL